MRRSAANRPRAGALCRAAGELIRDDLLLPRSRSPDPRQWTAIASALVRRRRKRLLARWTWRLAAPALAASVAALWILFGAGRPRLSYTTEGCALLIDARTGAGTVTTAASDSGRIVFSDGSTIALDGGTRGRLVLPERASKDAELVLEHGAVELSVVHRPDTRWMVAAGPFRIDVKGTQFHVAWSPERRHFRLDLRRGEVAVGGRPLATPRTVRSGEALEVINGQVMAAARAPATAREPPDGSPADGAAARARAQAGSTREDDDRRAGSQPAALEAAGAIASRETVPPATRTETEPGKDLTMQNEDDVGRISRAARTVGVAAAIGALGVAAPPSVDAAPPRPPGTPVAIGENGKLAGPMTGYAWVAAGAESTIDAPSPCNARGCFKDTAGTLCTRGTIPALRCAAPGSGPSGASHPGTCNWDTDWGAMIGMNTTSDGGPWLAGAPASISLAYHGRDERATSERGAYRLSVHVAGDPDSKVYCAETYLSGQVVDASMLKTECWSDAGETLGSFEQVDKVGLLLASTESATPFDYCISAIAVNGTALSQRETAAADSHVAIGSNGKLGGEMTGYAWVAGGAGTTFRTPPSCNLGGCFRNTQGRLCAAGAIAALSCTESNAAQPTCDWQTNWGAMIGLNANVSHAAWGAAAPSTVALTFSGPLASRYRFIAHVAGTAASALFCLEGYTSGQRVDPGMLRSSCWSGAGEPLSSFEHVDQIGLLLTATREPVPFDLCVSDVLVR